MIPEILRLGDTGFGDELVAGAFVTLEIALYSLVIGFGLGLTAACAKLSRSPVLRGIAWPAYGNEVILLLKGSVLVSTITVYDLMGETRSVFSRGYDDTVYLYAAALYLILALAVTGAFRLGERRMNRYLGAAG